MLFAFFSFLLTELREKHNFHTPPLMNKQDTNFLVFICSLHFCTKLGFQLRPQPPVVDLEWGKLGKCPGLQDYVNPSLHRKPEDPS